MNSRSFWAISTDDMMCACKCSQTICYLAFIIYLLFFFVLFSKCVNKSGPFYVFFFFHSHFRSYVGFVAKKTNRPLNFILHLYFIQNRELALEGGRFTTHLLLLIVFYSYLCFYFVFIFLQNSSSPEPSLFLPFLMHYADEFK